MKTFLELTWTDNENFQHKEIINVNNIEKIYIVLPDETEISVSENVNGKRRKFIMCFDDKGKCFSEFSRIYRALCGGFYD